MDRSVGLLPNPHKASQSSVRGTRASGAGWTPRHSLTARRTSDLIFRQRAGESPSAPGEARLKRLSRILRSACTPSGLRSITAQNRRIELATFWRTWAFSPGSLGSSASTRASVPGGADNDGVRVDMRALAG